MTNEERSLLENVARHARHGQRHALYNVEHDTYGALEAERAVDYFQAILDDIERVLK